MAAFAALAFFFPLAMLTAMVIAIVVFLVAVWKTMRAHESLADTAREAVGALREKGGA